ncbi:regulator of chromosome condensation 1/beta-lactamase-inhibitor protein II [Morchella snyderi]|nr:regulator of chromosome condensation 1/beta-lactamase-inhibitor protein II [Morchella snyderi]
MLYSFGSNGNGQLSLSHTTDTPTPTRCTSTTPLPAAPPVIVPGGNHTLLLFPTTGTAFAAGANTHAQCCHPPSTTTPPQLTSFRRVPPPPAPDTTHYTLASAGWSFTVLATAANNVYVSGHGGKGELGLGPATTSALLQRIPAFPPPGARVAALASGMAHTLAVMDDGAVYGWGAGRHGQLGAPAAAVVAAPRRVGGVGWPVEMAACGREFSVFVSRAEAGGGRRVVVLGRGGERYGLREGLVGGLMAGGDAVVGVQAGWGGVVVRFAGGAVRGWGRGDRGQLPPEQGLEVQALAVGSEHGVAVVAGGGVVAWGWGEHGNCGVGGDVPVGTVRTVPVPGARGRAVAVGAGCATSWVWVEEEGEGEAGEAGEGVGGAA